MEEVKRIILNNNLVHFPIWFIISSFFLFFFKLYPLSPDKTKNFSSLRDLLVSVEPYKATNTHIQIMTTNVCLFSLAVFTEKVYQCPCVCPEHP